jgi:signal transduction histidine kinase
MATAAGRQWIAILLGGALVAVALVAPVAPGLHHQAVLGAILETSVAIVGTLVALLAFGRYRRSRRIGDLAIACAVAELAWVHALFRSLPDLISPDSIGSGFAERTEIWGTLLVRLLAAGLLVMVVSPRWRVAAQANALTDQRFRVVASGVVAGAVALALLIWLAPVSHTGMVTHLTWSHLTYLGLKVTGAALFFVAYFRLSRLARQESDRFLGWIAVGCMFAAIATVSFTGLPMGASDTFQLGDMLLAAAVFTWAVGALCEIHSYWSDIADAARRETRRSVALDLHDGLAQELALLATYTYASAELRASPEWHQQLSLTAERALAEARRAIDALANDDPIPFDADLAGVAEAISQNDVDVHVEVDRDAGDPASDPLQRESIIRIVREAVSNAVRHGGARRIDIHYGGGGATSPILRVLDDGAGFDVSEASDSGRFGLVSMRERAEAIGASFEIESEPGIGTRVLVQWP